MAYGIASGFKCIRAGGVFISRKGADLLKVLLASLSRIYFFSLGTFSGTGSKGIFVGLLGGAVRGTGLSLMEDTDGFG